MSLIQKLIWECRRILACECVQARTLIQHAKFGADLTTNSEVLEMSCFTLNSKNKKHICRYVCETNV